MPPINDAVQCRVHDDDGNVKPPDGRDDNDNNRLSGACTAIVKYINNDEYGTVVVMIDLKYRDSLHLCYILHIFV